jgi:DNA-binding beta-propeller fold protein YncE
MARGADHDALMARLEAAKPGDVVKLEARTYKAGDLVLPDGVSLQGAGYGKTILDAAGKGFGLTLRGQRPARVSDLTIANSLQAGLLVEGATGLTVERVSVRRCGSALVVNRASQCVFQNLLLIENRSGVSLANSTRTALINASLVDTDGTGIRVNGCDHVAVFNNLVVNAPYAIALGVTNSVLALDHNLYVANYVGQMPGEVVRKKVESWYHLSGYDKHSLTIGVTFHDPVHGDYRPISPLSWAPIRATSSDWGVQMLGGFTAPELDMDGHPRVDGVDLGAYEASFPAPRPADGTFTVKSGEGITSAGLFTRDDRNVRYLFQNLPLAKGKYSYWLPSRDWQGAPIFAGDYQLKVTESDLRLAYVAAAGNGDQQLSTTELGGTGKRVSLNPHAVAFDADGRILVAQSGFESGLHVRAYDPQMTNFLWSFPGGGETLGMAVDEARRVLVMRKPNSLLRLDSATGKGAPFPDGSSAHDYPELKSVNGLTVLNGAVYVADPVAGLLVTLSGDTLAIAQSVSIPKVMQPAADTKAGLVWVITGEGPLATVDGRGTVTTRSSPVKQPALLAAGPNRLAIYSSTTRTITLCDSSDPAKLTPLRTLGTGDEGFGPIRGDRFWGPKSIALHAAGEVAVIDGIRTILFAADGSVKRQHMGMWGQQISYGPFADGLMHFFNAQGLWDIALDAKARRWTPGTRWRYTMEGSPLCFFAAGGANFGLFQQNLKEQGTWLGVVRMEADGTGRYLCRYGWDKEGLVLQRDLNGDGVIAKDDPSEPVNGPDGKRFKENFLNRGFNNIEVRADGSIVHPDRPGVRLIPMAGLDKQGVPQYDFAHARLIPATVAGGKPDYLSPYDFKTKETLSLAEDMFLQPDGTFAAVITTKSGGGPDLCTEHANGTSMAGFAADGTLRWLSPMNPVGFKMGFWGITTIGGITFAGRGAICEYETMDRDGLGTGVLGMPREFGWGGMWLDNHRQTQGFTGRDGKPYLITGDYCAQTYHWQELIGWDKVIHRSWPVKVSPALAETLSEGAPELVPVWPVPPPPTVTIKKLAGPLSMDGDPKKWRTLGIPPVVAISNDPLSNSSVLRLAYEGQNLYVQVIKFDDVITFHQREAGKHYLQDGVEFCINTFPEGWKYNVTRLADKGDIILRDRWFKAGTLLDPAVAPRVIKTYTNAVEFEERALIEGATGLDLRACQVHYTEFKLTGEALAGLPATLPLVLESGKTFRFGFLLNDNDTPGSDEMKGITWPVTYGTFERVEKLATGLFE